jgi:hypothetical protein
MKRIGSEKQDTISVEKVMGLDVLVMGFTDRAKFRYIITKRAGGNYIQQSEDYGPETMSNQGVRSRIEGFESFLFDTYREALLWMLERGE